MLNFHISKPVEVQFDLQNPLKIKRTFKISQSIICNFTDNQSTSGSIYQLMRNFLRLK